MKTIQKMTVLERDGVKLTQTIKGLVYPDERVIIYDLGEAVEEVAKRCRLRDHSSQKERNREMLYTLCSRYDIDLISNSPQTIIASTNEEI